MKNTFLYVKYCIITFALQATVCLLSDPGNHSDGIDYLLKVIIDKGEVTNGT